MKADCQTCIHRFTWEDWDGQEQDLCGGEMYESCGDGFIDLGGHHVLEPAEKCSYVNPDGKCYDWESKETTSC